jgi:hypothetical protein
MLWLGKRSAGHDADARLTEISSHGHIAESVRWIGSRRVGSVVKSDLGFQSICFGASL